MKTSIKIILLFSIIFCTILNSKTNTSNVEKIYYLAVGNSYYNHDKLSGSMFFENLKGANRSAKVVESIIKENSNSEGILLLSEKNNLLTKSIFFDSLKELVSKISKKKEKSLLIVYFCGHGVAEGINWNLFLVPGSFQGNKQEQNENVISFSEKTIYAMEIFEVLENVKFPYIIMMDNCYEGEETKLTSNMFSKTLENNLTDVSDIIKYMNQFHTSNAFIFSTKPGTLVSMVENPIDNQSSYSIGPLARRFILVLNHFKKINSKMTYGDFINFMTSESLDNKTSPGITFVDDSKYNLNMMDFKQ